MSKEQTSNTPERQHHPKKEEESHYLQAIEQTYSGPLPPSAEYARYDNTLPGSAGRILSMAEKQQEHNIRLEHREQLLHYAARFSSHILVGVIAITAISAGTYLITQGHDATGLGMILGSLATFATAIIFGKSKSKE